MIDRLFTLTLTFAVLAGTSLAFGGEFCDAHDTAPATPVVQLPRVVITGSSAATHVADAATEAAPRMQ